MNMTGSFIKYLLKRKSKFHIHSPFVYDMCINVLESREPYSEYATLSEMRRTMFGRTDTFETVDFGAGADKKGTHTYTAVVGRTAKSISHNRIQNELLFRMARHFAPTNILELGTAFGLSTAALALACPTSHVTTLEGCPNKASIAQKNLTDNGIANTSIEVGDFADTLPRCLAELGTVDFVFFDGNHRKSATLDYFEQCLAHSHSGTVFVFDDIHWSKGMEEAWDEIKNDTRVTLTADLYQYGLVFFREGMAKQNFVLKTRLFI